MITFHSNPFEMSESPHSEWYKVEAERFSKEYDLNGDGLLIGDEV